MKRYAFGFVCFGLAFFSPPEIADASATTMNMTGTTVRVGSRTQILYSSTFASVTTGAMSGRLGASGMGGVVFSTQYLGAGSGVFRSFLKLKDESGNNGTDGAEQAYNYYGADKFPMQQTNNPGSSEVIFGGTTSSNNLAVVKDALINVDGVFYYQFALDLNEPQNGNGSYISLDNVSIYSGSSPTALSFSSWAQMEAATQGANPTLNPIWSMDFGSMDSTVLLNANLSPGSGNANLMLYVPTSYFAGVPNSSHIYFYTQFGTFNLNGTSQIGNGTNWATVDFKAGSTPEEWAIYTANAIPEPAILGAALAGLAATGLTSRRKRL